MTLQSVPHIEHLRQVKSYVRREGRMTNGQRRALISLWPQFGIKNDVPVNSLNKLFGTENPKVLEIGFGMGESLTQMAQAEPNTDFIGIEVHRPGVGSILATIEKQHINNIKVMCTDAVIALESILPSHCFDRVQIFFPDPWHKTRHHKRRLIQADFIALIAAKLKPNGIIHLATDWENYALHMKNLLEHASNFENTAPNGQFAPRPDYRPLTKFERRGQLLGHGVWDLIYRYHKAST